MYCLVPEMAGLFPGQKFHGVVHCDHIVCILRHNQDLHEKEILDIDYLVKYCYNKGK